VGKVFENKLAVAIVAA